MDVVLRGEFKGGIVKFSVEEQDKYLLLRIRENIDFHGASSFKRACERLSSLGPRALIIETGDVDYICSSALGSLIFLIRRFGDAGDPVCLVEPRSKLRKIFELLHIPRLVTFVESEERAYEELE